ncbi:hypothetical protein [Microbacterium suwonense]|nr:hypothetical protein [Microbacterium suwonense]
MVPVDAPDRTQQLVGAETVLKEAHAIAGDGLLDFLVRHAAATASGHSVALAAIASDAETLGMRASAVDTRRMLGRAVARDSTHPTMSLWSAEATRRR